MIGKLTTNIPFKLCLNKCARFTYEHYRISVFFITIVIEIDVRVRLNIYSIFSLLDATSKRNIIISFPGDWLEEADTYVTLTVYSAARDSLLFFSAYIASRLCISIIDVLRLDVSLDRPLCTRHD